MRPIAKTMTAALGMLIATTAACAAPNERIRRADAMSDIERQRTIAATADGFVIRTSASDRAERLPAPVARRNHIPVGSDTHLDARLLSRPASTIQEISHAHP